MAKLSFFNQLAHDFADFADFIVVYIEESHPEDGWKFKNNINIKKARTLQDRLEAASILVNMDLNCPVYVDDVDDAGRFAYRALSERMCVVKDGVVSFMGGRGPVYDYPNKLKEWLQSYKEDLKENQKKANIC